MKKVFTLLCPFMVLGGALTSCSEDFDTNSEYKETAVIYGILDSAQSKQYIKVTKGYQNANGENALELASDDPEVIQYLDSILVTMEVTNEKLNKVVETIQLEKEFIENKEAGVFNSAGNYWYTFDTPDSLMNEDYSFKVKVKNVETNVQYESTTRLLGNFRITVPLNTLSFVSKGEPKSEVDLEYTSSKYAAMYMIHAIWKYKEINKAQPWLIDTVTFKSTLEKNVSSTRVTFSGELLIEAFVSSVDTLSEANKNIEREIMGIDMEIVSGTGDLREYIKAENSYSSITQVKPFYTNVKNSATGEEGAGIFGARKSINKFLGVSINSLSYLREQYPGLHIKE